MAFPSPAQNYTENRLNIGDFVRLSAHSHYLMISEGDYPLAGILKGALLVVDRALEAKDGNIVIAEIDGGLEIHRLTLSPTPTLSSLQNSNSTLKLAEGEAIPVWGVITYALNDLGNVGFNSFDEQKRPSE